MLGHTCLKTEEESSTMHGNKSETQGQKGKRKESKETRGKIIDCVHKAVSFLYLTKTCYFYLIFISPTTSLSLKNSNNFDL